MQDNILSVLSLQHCRDGVLSAVALFSLCDIVIVDMQSRRAPCECIIFFLSFFSNFLRV
jgi:hypothetical protein